MNTQRSTQLRTMAYEAYLKTPEWLVLRDKALARDGHRCRVCNSNKDLNVHHRTYARRGNEDLNDLTTLCQPCHEHFHRRISQADIMVRTYEDTSVRQPISTLQWEEYIIGMLLCHQSLIPRVHVILHETDLDGKETLAIYQLLKTAQPSNQPIENLVPPDLLPAAVRMIELAKSTFPANSEEEMAKESIHAVTRFKRLRLLNLSHDLEIQLKNAADAGDIAASGQIQQQILAVYQQIRVISSVSHLQG